MPHKLRKIRKTRGSRTQGYGRIGQHRDTGSKGYRKVGRHKHTWSYVTTYEPDYFSKKGFTSPQSLKQKEKTLNLQKLEEISNTTSTNEINLTNLGYTKLLGTGKITKPLTITIAAYSKTAAEKIKQAGGKIITTPQEHGE
ncbi:MAG: 50S ribosomal protein L15 [Candidatus Bathyarchaeota archaeon]|nr:50S ribosomal protein L15 [Candidatus Bathyarchaeota archaeon]